MSFFPVTLRCGSVFMACPTKQASFFICHFLTLGSCHLQAVPEKPSTSSNYYRKNKKQNNLCIVTQNRFLSCNPPKHEDADQAGLLGKFKLLE